MPNWCYNTLTITGPSYELTMFRETNRTHRDDGVRELDFGVAVPIADTQTVFSSIDSWGTKWNACETSVDLTTDELTYTFNTAWSPPLAWLETVIEMWDKLNFDIEYSEPGMNFGGRMASIGGEITSIEYNLNDHYWSQVVDCGMADELADRFRDSIPEEDELNDILDQELYKWLGLTNYNYNYAVSVNIGDYIQSNKSINKEN